MNALASSSSRLGALPSNALPGTSPCPSRGTAGPLNRLRSVWVQELQWSHVRAGSRFEAIRLQLNSGLLRNLDPGLIESCQGSIHRTGSS
eukprot:9358220-Pyramimonas_sp.AAC.1